MAREGGRGRGEGREGTSVEMERSSQSCESASSCSVVSSVFRAARMFFRRPLLEPKPGGKMSSNPAPS